jgi:FkbM family methyltransferase
VLDDPRRHLREMIEELPRYADKIKPGYTVVDLGANIGIVSEYAAERAGRVISVEPSVRHYDLLIKRMRSFTNATQINAAVWTHDGAVRFDEDPNNFTMDRVNYKTPSGIGPSIPCYTLPSLLRLFSVAHVDFLKMDIEGAELDILQHPTFAEAAPLIDTMWVEVHNYQNWEPCDVVYRKVEAAAKRHFQVISQNTWGWFFATRS